MPTDESNKSDSAESTDNHPYDIEGKPPLPGLPPVQQPEGFEDRGEVIWVVIELGNPNEDPAVDRAFHSKEAAEHHSQRINTETPYPSFTHATRLE